MSKTPLFIRIARPTYGKWLNWYHDVHTAGYGLLPKEGPYLILANHTHTYDAFFISSSLPVHVRWVAGAYLFKNQALKLLLGKWVGGIAKQQGRSDLQTIRDISAAFKAGEIVGLFPEGTRTWDGEPVGFELATAKLVRMFHVPVVIMHVEGAYGQKPRWAKKPRRGPITLRVMRVISPDELRALSVAQAHRLLVESLGFSHVAWQQEKRIPYVSPEMAEGLEKVLYLCPSCKGRSTIVTKGRTIRCTACDLQGELDNFDQLHPISGNFHSVLNIPSWHQWERKELATLTARTSADGMLFPPDTGVLLQKGVGKRLVTLSKEFTLSMTPSGMELVFGPGSRHALLQGAQSLVFEFKDVQSMIINAKSTVELYHQDQLWRIRIAEDRSIVKYTELYGAYREGLSTKGAQAT